MNACAPLLSDAAVHDIIGAIFIVLIIRWAFG